ncbi:MAG TPA: histidine triad nucleotide-binding protein [Patescibacteria group bacterium]|nr:histidine triad nucleotide-binding protein [Patescibacteria group bacterium]
MSDCIFCKIINKEQKADIVYEDEKIIAFKDINPSAPIHILIVPKKHIASIISLKKEDAPLMADLIWRGKLIAKEKGLDKKGYKLIFNCGKGGGQIIDHIHLHLLGGWKENKGD